MRSCVLRRRFRLRGIRRTREAWPDNPNDTLERPIMTELVGDLVGRRILDLGCGAAAFGVRAFAAGAQSYLGVDGSRNMIDRARASLRDGGGAVVLEDLETSTAPAEAFDLVVSSLVLHYIADLNGVLTRAFAALAPGGQFVCSVEHPVLTAADCGGRSGPCPDCLVDDYFTVGRREASWLGETVVKHHPSSQGRGLCRGAARGGVHLRAPSSPRLTGRDSLTGESTSGGCARRPFLFLSGRKPATPPT
jgi:SAM-dependent methyltransferase